MRTSGALSAVSEMKVLRTKKGVSRKNSLRYRARNCCMAGAEWLCWDELRRGFGLGWGVSIAHGGGRHVGASCGGKGSDLVEGVSGVPDGG